MFKVARYISLLFFEALDLLQNCTTGGSLSIPKIKELRHFPSQLRRLITFRYADIQQNYGFN